MDEDLDAVGCFLEFLYTGDYFPRKTAANPRELERDPATPKVDASGDQLLKHARVYTLAETLNLPALKSLASSKIHCVNSTAKGEIAYARYVYAHTAGDDTTIRAPVANFWATRSHTLRSEAEVEFRQMCLEFPQFGYDVLSMSFLSLCLSKLGTLLMVAPQPASWTRNSSAKSRTRCTLRLAAPASALAVSKPSLEFNFAAWCWLCKLGLEHRPNLSGVWSILATLWRALRLHTMVVDGVCLSFFFAWQGMLVYS